MEREDWKRIQSNWDYVSSETKFEYIRDDLVSSDILTWEDEQRITAEPVDADKMKRLLRILKVKKESYQAFLKALKKDHCHVIERLKATEVVNETLKESDDVSKFLRKLLLDNFVETPDEVCTLRDVQGYAKELSTQQGFNYFWKDDQLRDFVLEVFTGVKFEPGGKKKLPSFYHLKRRELDVADETEKVQDPKEKSSKPNLDQMDTENLCKVLEPIIRDLGINIDILEAFKEHEIDGQVFVAMKDEHFEKYLPQLKFGKRMKLMIAVKNLSGTEKDDYQISKLDTEVKDDPARNPVGCREFFRTFDSPVGPGDRYKAGNILPVSQYSREDMISPVRMFIPMADVKEDIGKVIAVNTVKFAVACLNDRTNGTIYAGVDEKNGEVVGIPIDKSDCEEHVRKLIRKAFYEDQLDIVYQAIRSPKFVQVDQTSGIVKYVVEIDIVPASQLVLEEMFFIKNNVVYGREKSAVAYSYVDGSLKCLDQRQTNDFGKKKKSLTQRRQAQEEARRPRENALSDRRQQILNLYGGGNESLQENIQPILMFSPLSENMNKEYVRENLSFLQHFESGANFDFEESREKKELYQYFVEDCEEVFEVLTTDNFEKSSEDCSAERLELLKTTQQKLWIFCNGYKEMDKDVLDAFQWKQNRLKGFKEALDVFKIPKSRAIILIFLFSKQYQPLLEASADVLMMFNERWMVLADDKDIANLWMDEMVRRNVASKDVLLSRCVIGMPWKHINETFKQILKFDRTVECEIPSSTGAFCTVPKKMLNQLTDIEILSRNLFDSDAEMADFSSRETKREHAEEMFYRGNPVEWINFWFGADHVLKRVKHATLESRVRKSLMTERNDNDERVGLTSLLHQPGAGGTTSSRQILWDLRTEYRCCVVRQITDQTADQISTLRDFEEKKQKKPPLVLIDNKDEESIMLLLHKLEKLAKIASWDEHYFPVFCAVLICERRINFPISVEVDKVLLGHELQQTELAFWEKKNKTLHGNYMKNGDVNPIVFISFNMFSKPITDRSMWQKRVNFVFGFNWSEPKAYDIKEGSFEGKGLELENKIRVTEERLTDLKAKKQTNKKKREKVRTLQAELDELETQRSKLNK